MVKLETKSGWPRSPGLGRGLRPRADPPLPSRPAVVKSLYQACARRLGEG